MTPRPAAGRVAVNATEQARAELRAADAKIAGAIVDRTRGRVVRPKTPLPPAGCGRRYPRAVGVGIGGEMVTCPLPTGEVCYQCKAGVPPWHPLRLTIPGPPRTKKNNLRRAWSRKKQQVVTLPSLQWERWRDAVQDAIPDPPARIAAPVNCAAVFYRDARRGDAVGFYQGLADVLEAIGVVVNDRYIVAWDGSRLDCDPANPRVEVTLTSVET